MHVRYYQIAEFWFFILAYPISISINNQTINVVDKFRLLGVLVDNKLKFDTYEDYLTSKSYSSCHKKLKWLSSKHLSCLVLTTASH